LNYAIGHILNNRSDDAITSDIVQDNNNLQSVM
jgi:hypothetical protein